MANMLDRKNVFILVDFIKQIAMNECWGKWDEVLLNGTLYLSLREAREKHCWKAHDEYAGIESIADMLYCI